jgi:hypothetical protein
MMIDDYVLDTNSNQILDFDQRRFAETFWCSGMQRWD